MRSAVAAADPAGGPYRLTAPSLLVAGPEILWLAGHGGGQKRHGVGTLGGEEGYLSPPYRRPSRGPSPITLACTLGPACPSPRALGSLLHGSPSHLLARAGSLWGCWIWIQACSGVRRHQPSTRIHVGSGLPPSACIRRAVCGDAGCGSRPAGRHRCGRGRVLPSHGAAYSGPSEGARVGCEPSPWETGPAPVRPA